MAREVIYAVVAVVAIIAGALAFTYQPGVEVRTKSTTVATTVTESPVTVTAAGTTTATTPGATAPPKISYDENLAKKGLQYFKELACNACHTVKAAGIEVGGNIGPDLSKALFGSVGVEKGTAGGPILMKYFEKNGLKDPAADPQKAAQLIAKFLTEGDKELAPTMMAQIAAFKQQLGDKWVNEYVPALVEMLKMAAAKS